MIKNKKMFKQNIKSVYSRPETRLFADRKRASSLTWRLTVSVLAVLTASTALFLFSSCSVILSIVSSGIRESIYQRMTADELGKLSDTELYEAIMSRTWSAEKGGDIKNGITELSEAGKVFFVLSVYEEEILNGGLAQFFVNYPNDIAPCLPEYLETVGATEHIELFETFLSENGINIINLNPDMLDFDTMKELYPFDDFDRSYDKLKPIRNYLISYIRDHISEF